MSPELPQSHAQRREGEPTRTPCVQGATWNLVKLYFFKENLANIIGFERFLNFERLVFLTAYNEMPKY